MDKFKREERYIVVKLSDLDYDDKDAINGLLAELCVPNRQCLVIESDWPEYEPTWAAIEARVTGADAEQPATWSRMAACLAACDGIEDDTLRQVAGKGLFTKAVEAINQHDGLLAALELVQDCLVKCLTGGEVSAKLAGKAIEQAATVIDKAKAVQS